MRHLCLLLAMILLVWQLPAARAADMQFVTSDGVRLHLIEAGPPTAKTIVLVPGWTMPAWIFQAQIDFFSSRYHVVAMDPRGQGSSDIPAGGYNQLRRGRDIGDLIASLRTGPVLLVGWSLGVLDSLSYVEQFGDAGVAGMVLIDNSVGEEPAPVASRALPRRGPRLGREEQMQRFVASMFHNKPSQAYLDALTDAALRTPAAAAAQLANYPVPRSYWKEAIYTVRKPILYVVRPGLAGQAGNLVAHHPAAEASIFQTAGHALFVDEAARFNQLMESFIRRRVWN